MDAHCCGNGEEGFVEGGFVDIWCVFLALDWSLILKNCLVFLARSKTLTKLGVEWQDTLKKAVNDD